MRKRTGVRWLVLEALLWVAVILLPGGVLLLPVALGVHRVRLAPETPARAVETPRSA